MDRAPRVLALDIGSGGPGAARFDPALRLEDLQEQPWDLSHGQESASLGAWGLLAAIEAVVGRVARRGPSPAAIAVSSMMHSLLLTDTAGRPLSPVSTWLDRTPVNGGAERIRQRLGPTYTARTGGRVHPSFPATRFARLASEGRVPASCRVDSIPSWVLAHWTGTRAEDESTASASGFLNLATGEWDRETLAAVDLEPDRLPSLVAAGAIAGGLGAEAAARTGLPAGLPVVVGGGDGFLAALGSGCRTSPELAITLGTSAAVRRFQPAPADTTASGLFCYRQAGGRFLVGGASSNGGNVLDWARRNLGEARVRHAGDAPLFFPFVFGERTPFWDPGLRPRWVGVGSGHTARDLAAAVPEAIAFSVARQTQLLSETGPRPEAGFLSGNAFETPELDRVLATLAPFPIIRPPAPGLATLRGAAIMGFRALGIDPPTRPADSVPVPPLGEGRAEAIRERFGRFLEHYVR